MVSVGVHRPKNTSLNHCFHVTSKHVVKSKNWGRKELFLSMCRDKLLAFYSWGWKWTVFFAACNSRAQILCWPDSVWLPAQQKNTFLATLRSACLPFSSSVPGYTEQMPYWTLYMPVICLAGWTRSFMIAMGLGVGGVEQAHQGKLLL